MDLATLQARMEALYGDRDRDRGIDATVAWLAEELGELAKAVRKGTREDRRLPQVRGRPVRLPAPNAGPE